MAEAASVGPVAGRASCEVSAALGDRIGLPPSAIAALDDVHERWDGRGLPEGRSGDGLTLAGRIVHVAERAVLAHAAKLARSGARAEVARRSGGHLDPALCERFAARSGDLLAALWTSRTCSPRSSLSSRLRWRSWGATGWEAVAEALATFTDLEGAQGDRRRLVVSARTVQHQLASVYDKTGGAPGRAPPCSRSSTGWCRRPPDRPDGRCAGAGRPARLAPMSTLATQHATAIAELYEAFGRGDIAAILDAIAEDVR